MPVKSFRPLTPSTRYITIASYAEVTRTKPEKSLVVTRKKTGGRNCYGRVTARGIGGGHKQKIRLVDFKRDKHGVEATVSAIEYDPIRTARLALLEYKDGDKRYIIAPNGIRPINRGVSRNPVDHPNGGGAGKSKSGGGWQQLTSPWGLQAKGYRTRHKRKLSSRFIVVRRDGRPMKQK